MIRMIYLTEAQRYAQPAVLENNEFQNSMKFTFENINIDVTKYNPYLPS